jgi:hypothetical protein
MLIANYPSTGYTRNFDYCLKLINVDQHPNYLFFARIGSINPGLPTAPYILFQENQCVPIEGYRPVITVVAIAKTHITPGDLEPTSSGTILRDDRTKALKQHWLEGAPQITAPLDQPIVYFGQQIEDRYQIQAITPTDVQLSLVERSPQIPSWILFLTAGILVLGGIFWHRRRFRKTAVRKM